MAQDTNRSPREEEHAKATRRPRDGGRTCRYDRGAGPADAHPRRLRRRRQRHRPRQRHVHEARKRAGRRQAQDQLHPGRAARQRHAGHRADDARLGAYLRRRARLVRQLGQGPIRPRLGLHLPRHRPPGRSSSNPTPTRPTRRSFARSRACASSPRPRRSRAFLFVKKPVASARRPRRHEDAGAGDPAPTCCSGRRSERSPPASPGARCSLV